MLATAIVTAARERGVRIAVAESLTGGQLAAAIVDVPGASAVLSGGLVTYATELKHTLLGVDAELLARRGPVDGEVARQMARGAREACAVAGEQAGLGIATTGVAGPDPDAQSGQPAGTVWLGVSSALGERAELLALAGTRAEIRQQTVAAALRLIAAELAALPAAD